MKTINSLFNASVEKYSNNTCILEKEDGAYKSYSYKDIQTQVYQFAAGLLAQGVQKGDRLALLAEGRKDWVVSELGILHTGAINIPLSVRLAEPEEIRFRLEHAGAKMIIVSKNQYPKIAAITEQVISLEKIILLDPLENTNGNVITAKELIKKGKVYLQMNIQKFENTWKTVADNDYANICYTSGTTADPKGIILTHGNYTANTEQSRSLMDVPEWYTTLLILPWDHAFAHTCGIYTVMSAGASLASVALGNTPMETLKNIPINIKEIKPVFLLSVPALAKNFKKNIEKGVRDKGKIAESLFKMGLSIAYTYNGTGWNKGKGLRFLLKPLVKLFDVLLFRKIREGFGGRLKFFIGGGALLDIDFQRFFYAIGIPMFQGYGLTEAAPVISSNSERKHKMGSSGYLVENLELKICDEKGHQLPIGEKGEIVVKGENVMVGYWENQEATQETIKNGWLHTGDLGYMDKDGFLYVLGRFKSLLIADDGEKFSPEGIEEAFISHSAYIDQCMMYNNQKPYSVVLIVPAKEGLKRWINANAIDTEKEEGLKKVLGLIEQDLNEYRKGGKYSDMFPQRWLPASIGILSEAFSEQNHMINSTMKMVRPKITDYYQELLDFMYTPEGKNLANMKNITAIKQLLSE